MASNVSPASCAFFTSARVGCELLSAALHLDAPNGSHPVRAEVKNAQEAGESFDAITYEKGGAILRMIESYLGEERFRDGIRLYMRRYREANATADDLWGALDEASGQPILELANGWIRRVGYPLLSVAEQGGRIVLRQRRFFSDPEAKEEGPPTRWLVPIVLRYRDRGGVREQRELLRGEERAVSLEAQGEPGWVLANAGARGFYRVAYEAPLLRRLIEALPELESEERMNLVSDQWALVRAGALEVDGFLRLLEGVARRETDHSVLDEVVSRLSWIEYRGVSDADRPALQSWIRRLFAAAGSELGWDALADEDDERRLRRAAVLRALALVARDPQAVEEAQERFRRLVAPQPQPLDPNLLAVLVAAAARTAGHARTGLGAGAAEGGRLSQEGGLADAAAAAGGSAGRAARAASPEGSGGVSRRPPHRRRQAGHRADAGKAEDGCGLARAAGGAGGRFPARVIPRACKPSAKSARCPTCASRRSPPLWSRPGPSSRVGARRSASAPRSSPPRGSWPARARPGWASSRGRSGEAAPRCCSSSAAARPCA